MAETSDVMPEGDDIRKAVKWVSERRRDKDTSDHVLLEEACVRFDLSPKKADLLRRFLASRNSDT